MANQFCFRRSDPPDQKLCISNGATDALINVLVLAGSALAETESQKRLIVWIAEHDQITGRGIVGFAVTDMPWSPETFAQDKQFMLRVIDAASQKTGWEKLDYTPNEQFVYDWLVWFKRSFLRMTMADIKPQMLTAWMEEADEDDPIHTGFPCCQRHGTLLSYLGCQICND